MIPITRVNLGEKEYKLVRETLLSGWVTQGPRVEEFERKFAGTIGAKYCVAVSSCTAGLFLSLHALGIGPGNEVIVPSFSFIATANSAVHCGATPVFVDIDPATYNIGPAAIESAITGRTAAIIAVHQVGQAADLDRIYEIAVRHGIPVVEDAACAIGTRYKGRPVGSEAEFACFSFHPRKIITTGEGGMVATRSEKTAEKLKMLRNQGVSVSGLERHRSDRVVFEHYPVVGYNFRMTDIQAAVGIAQLDSLGSLLKERSELACRYSLAFSNHPVLQPPFVPEYSAHTFQTYLLRLKANCPLSRDELMQRLLDRGISTRRGVMCAHLEPCYAEIGRKTNLRHSEAAAEQTVALPLYPGMTEGEQNTVISSVLELTTPKE
ncbi:MAG TPA: DegT/DnrJ/EryC1/StrS family aminotransferase [archaeon]|nr:DegT/DnrJ/EryC1/StrS family aminotransferase [archaeon]